MTLKIEIQIKRANLTARMHARLMKIINRKAMERQLTERVPRHFDEGHDAEYEIRPRSRKYVESKRRKRGHNKPNVQTGQLKQRIRGKITATQYGARLVLRSSIGKKIGADKWAAMSPTEKRKAMRNQRRLTSWQKREIAIMSRKEIKEERQLQAKEYRTKALSPEFARKRTRRIR